ncbi:glycosyltransferase family 4 protein [Actinopolymorpha pittospori]|uniref:Glycosyltransferase involved in cell wall biosynthesis n=1 Tax=Actinopolymorpha pittospori TaxID=648752 RepID=A0A927MMJ4_9ACTN|nr:glycosyltransferase family 4 protein [Actinopolymorpha pittospori]MBE1603279.1 glycosyltransferase involved in cell wall biosynthesis [Actinopolymorpha pittospori]
MRVGLLSQWFDPEPGPASLPGVLARGLAKRGHEVRVLTGFPNYPTGRLMSGYRMARRMEETLEDVRIRRVALYPSHDASPVHRVATYGSFAMSAIVSGVDALRDLDAVWVSNSPITVSLPMWFVRYVHKVPVVLHVLDLWPDSVRASGLVAPGRTLRALERGMSAWCRGMYRSAGRIAYISPGVGDLLQRRGVAKEKLVYIPMWADESALTPAANDMRAELSIGPDQTVLVYAGTLGETQGLTALVDACAAVVDDRRLVCLVAGSGVAEESLRQRARTSGATNIRFLGRLPKERMPALMATGDVHFVGLRPTSMAAYTMPSKVQATLASGRAMLVAGEGDVATVARQSGAAVTVLPDDPVAIAAGIRAMCDLGRDELRDMGRQGRAYYARTFSVEAGVERVEAALLHAKGMRVHL